jgi:hypothetical protein
MNEFLDINLLHLFGFYLALMFLFSVYRRWAQYRAIGGLVLSGPGRWPRLLELVWRQGGIFLTWSTFLPAILALGLTLIHWLASRLVWPDADVTLASLGELTLAWPVVGCLCLAMLGVDFYCTVVVSDVDQAMLKKYFDEAEYWLCSWTAPVVNILSFGKINPRQMVAVEVRKALLEASQMLNANLWWLAAQIGLRFSFGLSLWLSYALAIR